MKKKRKEFTVWAINANSKEGHGFLGRYWHFWGLQKEIPIHMKGCKVALFETRSAARCALKFDKQQKYVPYAYARVSKVKVTIKEI